MSREFLKQLHKVWSKAGLLEDTSNPDFYFSGQKKKSDQLRYVVFDSGFTSYENLGRLDRNGVNFITIRRRRKKMLERIANLPKSGWKKVIRKYAHRWIVEKSISEQIDFFHLNLVSSSMVIKVDFDLTLSILANNLYRLLALQLERYSHLSVQSLCEKLVLNGADIIIKEESITVQLRKKRNLPLILEVMQMFSRQKYP